MNDIIKRFDLSLIAEEDRSEKVCIDAVTDSWDNLQYVPVQTKNICMAAIARSGYSLQYIENQTEEICLAAVKKDGLSLEYAKIKTEEICFAAVQSNSWAIYDSNYFNDYILLACIDTFNFNNIDFLDILKRKADKAGRENYIFTELLERLLADEDFYQKFKNKPFAYCAEIISKKDFEYIVNLRDKISDVFNNNEDLLAVYEKALISHSINSTENNKLKIGKIM